MQHIRDKFHEIMGKLNVITLGNSTFYEMVRMSNYKDINDPEELKTKLDGAMEKVKDSENAAMELYEIIAKLKGEVYSELGIDTKKGKGEK